MLLILITFFISGCVTNNSGKLSNNIGKPTETSLRDDFIRRNQNYEYSGDYNGSDLYIRKKGHTGKEDAAALLVQGDTIKQRITESELVNIKNSLYEKVNGTKDLYSTYYGNETSNTPYIAQSANTAGSDKRFVSANERKDGISKIDEKRINTDNPTAEDANRLLSVITGKNISSNSDDNITMYGGYQSTNPDAAKKTRTDVLNRQDLVSKILNYSSGCKDEGCSDGSWSPVENRKCIYEFKRYDSIPELDEALEMMNRMQNAIAPGHVLHESPLIENGRRIDLNSLDPRNIRITINTATDSKPHEWIDHHGIYQTKHREINVETYNTYNVSYSGKPIFTAKNLDPSRLKRGWSTIYKKFCAGAKDAF